MCAHTIAIARQELLSKPVDGNGMDRVDVADTVEGDEVGVGVRVMTSAVW
jgi:hypothetical protein